MSYPMQVFLPHMDRTVTVRTYMERILVEQCDKLQEVIHRRQGK